MRFIRAIVCVAALLSLTALPCASRAQVYVSITTAPPPLPVYVQPVIPGPDYMWVPGYWAWGSVGYYWVPGTWVLAPGVGMLWTPGYWAWNDGIYAWRVGYWGPRVGFYGGINYGYGYTGVGYQGGYWSGRVFTYNSAVVNVGSVRITNVYSRTVINNTTVTNVSFNGGRGGATAQPTPQEQAAGNDKHFPATGLQAQHEHAASTNRALFASVNHGRPNIAATAKAGQFAGQGIVAAKGVNPPGKSLAVAKGPPGPSGGKQLGPQGPKQPPQFKAAKMAGPAGPRPPPRRHPGDHAKKPGQP
jgi:hypothetical protein